MAYGSTWSSGISFGGNRTQREIAIDCLADNLNSIEQSLNKSWWSMFFKKENKTEKEKQQEKNTREVISQLRQARTESQLVEILEKIRDNQATLIAEMLPFSNQHLESLKALPEATNECLEMKKLK